jgi:hypothetical protein
MLPNSPDVLPQSSNMLSQSTVTAWQRIYLLLLCNTRRYYSTFGLVMLTPKWSTFPGGKSPSCFESVLRHPRHNLQLLLYKAATYFGKQTTSCVGASEDTRPTLFGKAHRRSDLPHRAINSPHVFKHPEYSFTIFKHAFTRCSHNRADNLPLSCKQPEGNLQKRCLAYTEVVRLA